jgi:hypothetical protein
MNEPPADEPLRPRTLALLLLASGDLLPRQRARDQQADVAGMELKRRVLQRLAERDPEPAELDAVLAEFVEETGPPFGPTRAVAGLVRDEWRAALVTPEWVAQLVREAVEHSDDQSEGKRRRRRSSP